MEDRKIIGITMGDPASIGPEITVKALADQSIYEACRPIVVGDACVLKAALKIVGHEELTVRAVKDVKDAVFTHGTIDVLDMELVSMDGLVRGQVSAMCGDAAFRYVEKVIELAMDGQVDATVTNAFNKEAVNLAGHHYSGHTEIYADLTGTKNYTMMLAHENMRVVHVSTHVSLREACDRVKKQRVLDVIRIGDRACREMGIENPRIAVAGLNPHSGEHGLFGQEEIQEIIPAIEEARKRGINAIGPVPPDTLFSRGKNGEFDAILAMYHDQGHMPCKTLDLERTVSVTLGLPFLRCSVDHGTAFDIAGKGIATNVSMTAAIDSTVKYAKALHDVKQDESMGNYDAK